MPRSAITLGEVLVDFVKEGDDEWLYRSVVGGAPANVAVAMAATGVDVAHIGRVGNDWLGEEIRGFLHERGVSTEWLTTDPSLPTAVAVASTTEGGSTDFILHLRNAAASALDAYRVPSSVIAQARVIHVGTLSSITEESEAATHVAIDIARHATVRISLDVNLRPRIWADQDAMIRVALRLVQAADVVKMTADELRLLQLTPAAVLEMDTQILVVTDGSRAAAVFTREHELRKEPSMRAAGLAVGAGDAFMGAFLSQLLAATEPAPEPSRAVLEPALEAAVHAGTAQAVKSQWKRPGASVHEGALS